ncbi:cytochrome-c peroxidase [Litoribacillus peritrichatus]|uniref:Cytochrome c domain-containing protein n=1 Tax=Litoribacillus peritrichatus TaxID=718191 RepID=A0ABP7MJJ2_9GAMM
MKIQRTWCLPTVVLATAFISACSDSSSSSSGVSELDTNLSALIASENLTGDPTTNRDLPNITDLKAQLGMKLFYTKNLGGDQDSACVTCHHPVLGGGDNLSLPVGVNAASVDLLGLGRVHNGDGAPNVPRNAPTVFNLGLWDQVMFHDSRVESIGKESGVNGANSGIRTPDSAFGVADAGVAVGQTLAAAQARFPVTSNEEMRGNVFEAGNDNDTVRTALATRLQGDADWLTEFQTGFSSTADAATLITYDNIAEAIGEYERSMVFTNTPWSAYVAGNTAALTETQKLGAVLFFTAREDSGAGCSGCHSGDFFTDESHHVVAFPLIGNGKGNVNASAGNDDFGRERETGDVADRYKFRTPTLLNISATAPYGHTGSYQTLEDVVRHYTNPRGQVTDYFDVDGGWCQLTQFTTVTGCAALYPDARTNSLLAVDKLDADRLAGESEEFASDLTLSDEQVNQLVAFLEALTDPCVESRTCLAPWIPDTADAGPDGLQLNAVNADGSFL